jgi:two-component system alkaline phosphatase synthesis response regulator PhoP
MTKVGHIYLIDDDNSMRESLARMLRDVGYLVEDHASAVKFLETSTPVSPAVILLDMQMPDMTGVELQEQLVKLGRKTPIVFVSGQSHPHQIVQGLKKGAVDFLFKPFNLEELLLRIQVLLKRSGLSAEIKESVNTFNLDGFQINFQNMMVITPTNKSVSLTKKENALLRLLVERKNEVVSRESIVEIVWGYDVYPSTRTIDNFIVTFRKLFEKDPSEPKHFFSVRGVGYKFME